MDLEARNDSLNAELTEVWGHFYATYTTKIAKYILYIFSENIYIKCIDVEIYILYMQKIC